MLIGSEKYFPTCEGSLCSAVDASLVRSLYGRLSLLRHPDLVGPYKYCPKLHLTVPPCFTPRRSRHELRAQTGPSKIECPCQRGSHSGTVRTQYPIPTVGRDDVR